MKKRVFEQILENAQHSAMKKQCIEESLLERLWLLPEVGHTYLEPCFDTNEHAIISRTCQSLSNIISNARSFIFCSPSAHAFDKFLCYVNTKTFSQLRNIFLEDLYSNRYVSPVRWILKASCFPRLQRIETRYCNSIKLVLENDIKPHTIVDIIQSQSFQQTVELVNVQSLINYTTSVHMNTRNALTKIQSLRILKLFGNSLVCTLLNGPIPLEVYNFLESLSVFSEKDPWAVQQQSFFMIPYPKASTPYALKDLHLHGISTVSLPSGVGVFKNLKTLQLFEVSQLTVFNNSDNHNHVVASFPNLEKLELSITFQWIRTGMKYFCDSNSFPKVRVVNLTLFTFQQDTEETLLVLDLKQYFPVLESATLRFNYYKAPRNNISVIAGSMIQTLHLHFDKFLPQKITVSSSTSLRPTFSFVRIPNANEPFRDIAVAEVQGLNGNFTKTFSRYGR